MTTLEVEDVGPHADPPRRRSRVGSVVRNTLLNLAAGGGVLCIVLVILAATFHISLILFKTGSMSPAIPAGSVALVRQIPAAQVEIGDVVTVDRPGRLPITHRVIAIKPATDGQVWLTLRGDANPAPDAAPYLVSTVRRVLTSAAGLAPVIVAVSERWVMVAVTLTISALVTWAFWPRDGSGRARRAKHRAS
ncbi:signal peptidase, endoplasmic reticulum-type [Nakamurella panacisegetis]|uniref:Signal peptidase I n=1 Tax=Nakamurella panacisegetis TaxID=1090615 RepID=A0A1H0S4H8_9ACTN|nr:signal peptidase I [Nakamurella panacisegetis]SDP36673.1 signal peptidase, endoplasmic reticulum-type [Nakamurella panacisegetis]